MTARFTNWTASPPYWNEGGPHRKSGFAKSRSLQDGKKPSRVLGYGIAYERLFTNLIGAYGGMAFRRNHTGEAWVAGGSWYRGGMLIEAPWSRGTLTFQAGAISSSKLARAANVEFRASWTFWHRNNRRRFGRFHPRVWKKFSEY